MPEITMGGVACQWWTPDGAPLAAVMMFFDPKILAESSSCGVTALIPTRSLQEVETIFKEKLGGFPESRLKPVIRFFD